MEKTTKALFEFYSRERKADFYNAYLYMKYLHQFENLVMEEMKVPLNPAIEKIPPALEEMLEANLKIIADVAGQTETDIYHAKIVSLNLVKKIIAVNEDINLEVPETVLPFKLARNIILEKNVAIALGVCPCRLAQAECTCMPSPLEACLFIGDPHASFIAEHNPRFRKICLDEAISVLEDCQRRGFVHCAYFKQDMGNKMFAICNCCSCCCGGIKTHNFLVKRAAAGRSLSRISHIISSGMVAVIGKDCTGCQACIEACQFHALEFNEEKNQIVLDFAKCMGCGVCKALCPAGAVTLKIEPSKGGILDPHLLKKSMAD